ncbi:hypothetical protein F6Z27_10105 [Salmonella enterica]|nr:hypothetical protein [Salmonella enterica]ECX9514380.1 hypothetical protein [Salmonella enterica]
MYFSKETLATNSRLGGHWNELWANRNMWNAQHDAMIAANRSNMTPEWLAVNAVGGLRHQVQVRLMCVMSVQLLPLPPSRRVKH